LTALLRQERPVVTSSIAGMRAIAPPAELTAVGDDELFLVNKYRPLLDEAGRIDIQMTVLPATGHINLTCPRLVTLAP
jgi:hypothetical protein